MKILDLFCKAGGASMGLHQAFPNAEIVGVDIEPQPRYPFRFVQADVMGFKISELIPFDFIWASPPCQDHMQTPHRKHGTGWLLDAIRQRLEKTCCLWAIENVPGAPLRVDYSLCGCMFGEPNLRRERWFETSWNGFAMMPPHKHEDHAISVVGHGTPSWVRKKLGRCPSIKEYRKIMRIDWMNRDELSQAVPPFYAEFIGLEAKRQLAEGN